MDSAVWTSMIVESKQDKGTLTSLINAGYVFHEDEGRDSQVGLTDTGFLVMKQYYGV
jgi:predicted transcriptional regulator